MANPGQLLPVVPADPAIPAPRVDQALGQAGQAIPVPDQADQAQRPIPIDNDTTYIKNLFLLPFNNIDKNKNFINKYYVLCQGLLINNIDTLIEQKKWGFIDQNIKNTQELYDNIKTISVDIKLKEALKFDFTSDRWESISGSFKTNAYAFLNTIYIMFEFINRLINSSEGNPSKYAHILTYLNTGSKESKENITKYAHCKRVLDNVYPLFTQLYKYPKRAVTPDVLESYVSNLVNVEKGYESIHEKMEWQQPVQQPVQRVGQQVDQRVDQRVGQQVDQAMGGRRTRQSNKKSGNKSNKKNNLNKKGGLFGSESAIGINPNLKKKLDEKVDSIYYSLVKNIIRKESGKNKILEDLTKKEKLIPFILVVLASYTTREAREIEAIAIAIARREAEGADEAEAAEAAEAAAAAAAAEVAEEDAARAADAAARAGEDAARAAAARAGEDAARAVAEAARAVAEAAERLKVFINNNKQTYQIENYIEALLSIEKLYQLYNNAITAAKDLKEENIKNIKEFYIEYANIKKHEEEAERAAAAPRQAVGGRRNNRTQNRRSQNRRTQNRKSNKKSQNRKSNKKSQNRRSNNRRSNRKNNRK